MKTAKMPLKQAFSKMSMTAPTFKAKAKKSKMSKPAMMLNAMSKKK